MKRIFFVLTILLLAGTTKAQLQFSDVAPIFYSRCGSCHNPYGHGSPFMNYSEILSHTGEITTYLNSGYMPPLKTDTTYSRFADERTITEDEKNDILTWIANGAPAGDTTLAPAPPSYSRYQLNGTADLELSIPTFVSNAYSTDAYNCFSLPTGLTQDRIIRAYEIVAGNPSIVHHAIVKVDTMGTTVSDLSGMCYSTDADFMMGGYAPGAEPTVFPGSGPLKMGIRIKAGSNIVIQIHYEAGSGGQTDSTKIRLFFYPPAETGIRPVYVDPLLKNTSLFIPANTVVPFTAVFPPTGGLPHPISMFAAFPHSHSIARKIMNCAYSGTDTIPLIQINDWDFNWQGYYTYRHVVKIPAGYKLFSEHVFDNTTDNLNNPSSPPIDVYGGTRSIDEMFVDSYQWLYYLPGDELVDIDSIIDADPLLAGIPAITYHHSFSATAYPNPTESSVNIDYSLDKTSNTIISIYSISGTLVKSLNGGNEAAGPHHMSWDRKNESGRSVAPGTYIYIIHSGKQQYSGKIVLL